MPPWLAVTAIIGAALAAIFVAGKAMPPPPSDKPALTAKEGSGSDAGKPLPIADFSGKMPSGETFRFSDLKGKVVLINFWASWCGPCRMEAPDLVKIQEKYRDRGFTIVGLSQDDSLQLAADAAKEDNLNYPVLIAPDEVSQAFQISALPTSFLVNRDGKIVWSTLGMTNEQAISDEIEKAL